MALPRPAVDPPPTATTASAPRSFTTRSASSVTPTGVCMTAPAKTPADRSPSEAAILLACASARPGVLSTSARRAPTRSTSGPSRASVPAPKITRVGRGSWTKGPITAHHGRRADPDEAPRAGDGRVRPNTTSRAQLRRDPGDVLALEAHAVQLDPGRLAAAVAAGDRGRAVGRVAHDLGHAHLALERVRQADDDEAEVEEDRVEGQDRRLLPAVLGGRGREHRADLADERALHPEPAGLVEEVLHLRRHVAVARAGAEDDGVVVRQLVDRGDGRGLVELEAGLAGDLLGHELGHPLHDRLGAAFPRPFGGGVGHRLDVAVGRVVEHENLGHRYSPRMLAETEVGPDHPHGK